MRRPLMQAAGLILFALLLAVLYRQWDYFYSRSPLLCLAARKAAWICPEPKVKTGYLARYAKMVTSAARGAVLE